MGLEFSHEGKKYTLNLKKIGNIAKAIVPRQIKKRTKAGIDMDGKQFEKYGTKYAQEVENEEGNSSVDLERTPQGGMLDSIELVSGNIDWTDVELVFKVRPEHQQKAEEHHFGRGWLPKRKFFGLSKQQIEELKKAIMRAKIFE
jgi:hypothetical protein